MSSSGHQLEPHGNYHALQPHSPLSTYLTQTYHLLQHPQWILTAHQLTLIDCISRIYINNLISIGLTHPLPDDSSHCCNILHLLTCIHHSESSFHAAAISVRKLISDGQPAKIKTILGWLINSWALTICLPPDKYLAWTNKILYLLTQGFATNLNWRLS